MTTIELFGALVRAHKAYIVAEDRCAPMAVRDALWAAYKAAEAAYAGARS